MSRSLVRKIMAGMLSGAVVVSGATVFGQEPRPRTGLEEPIHRITNTGANPVGARAPHPLDPALDMAYEGQERIRRDIFDYTAVIAKRERFAGVLPAEPDFIFAKIRNRKTEGGKTVVPFAVYMRYLAPEAKKDCEAIYVEGSNNNKIVAHGTGLKGFITVSLDPLGKLAMDGNRYPITALGMDHMISELILKGERDRKRDEIKVQFFRNAKVDDRTCTCLTVTHPEKREYFDFNVAQIFIDDELRVPIRYAAYQWPTKPGEGPVLDEEYTYLDMKLNVGLTEADFDPRNPDYDYPRINR